MSAPRRTPALTVYSRAGCALCDELVGELAAFAAPRGLDFRVDDVDADPELRRRYGLRVPVLVLDGTVVCHGHLDETELARLLAR